MRVPILRVPAHRSARGGGGGAAQQRARAALSRTGIAHLAWSAAVLAAAAIVIGLELAATCPPGGPIAFGDCETVRPFAIGVVALAAGLYVAGLSAVRWWTQGLQRRGLADGRAARDWYLLAGGLGLIVAPLLAFTLASALR
jgi:hypothetical protein